MKLKGQLEQAQLENKSTDPSNLPDGLIWLNTATNKIKAVINGVVRTFITDVDLAGNADEVIKRDGSGVLGSGKIVDANVDAAAAIARSKLGTGSNDHVVINSGAGAFSSEAQLAKSRGGIGADASSITFPASGTITTLSANNTWTGLNTFEGVFAGDSVSDGSTTGSDIRLATPTKTLHRLTNSGVVSIAGITAPAVGQIFILSNFTGVSIVIKNLSSAEAVPTNRIASGTGSDITMLDQSSLLFVYEGDGACWYVVGGSGGGASVVSGSRGSPNNISAGTGITSALVGSESKKIIFIQGNGGHVTVTATPAIADGSTVGQELFLVGRNSDQTVTIDTISGDVELNGQIIFNAGTVLHVLWDGTAWVELSRSN